MQISKLLIASIAGCFGATFAYADGFVVAQSLSNGRELRLFEHAPECGGGPGAFIYKHDKRVDQTCNVNITPAGATIVLPAFEPHIFIPRDTLYQNANG